MGEDYNIKNVLKYGVLFVLFMFSLRFSLGFSALILLPYALVACFSRKNNADNMFWVLLMTCVCNITNDFFVSKSFIAATAFRVVYFIWAILAVSRIPPRKWTPLARVMGVLFIYLFYEGLVSLPGYDPIISGLKLMLLITFLLSCLSVSAMDAMTQQPPQKLREMTLSVIAFCLLGSLAVYPFPTISRSMAIDSALGYGIDIDEAIFRAVNHAAGLYSGVTFHSQTLGPLCVILNAFLLSDYVYHIRRKSWFYFSLLIAAPVLIYMTGSRTAMGGYIFSVMITAWFAAKSRTVPAPRKMKLLVGVCAIVFVGTLSVFIVPSLRERVAHFVVKYGDDVEVNAETIMMSRMGKLEEGMAGFRRSPLIGNGFQVNEMTAYWKDVMKDKGLLKYFSSPIEKSFWPIMVLEEGGIIGMLLFLWFVGSVIVVGIRTSSDCFLICFLTTLVLNLGEATVFSVSANGGLMWVLSFVALAFDVRRNRMRQAMFSGGYMR